MAPLSCRMPLLKSAHDAKRCQTAETALCYSENQKVTRLDKDKVTCWLVGRHQGKPVPVSHHVSCCDNRSGLTGFGCCSSTVTQPWLSTSSVPAAAPHCNQQGPSILVEWKCVSRTVENTFTRFLSFHLIGDGRRKIVNLYYIFLWEYYDSRFLGSVSDKRHHILFKWDIS